MIFALLLISGLFLVLALFLLWRLRQKVCVLVKTSEQEFILYARRGSNLLEVLRANQVTVPTRCGGSGTCQLCMCKVVNGHTELTSTEKHVLNAQSVESNKRLACQVELKGDIELEI